MKKTILSLLSLLMAGGTMIAQNQMHVNMNDGSTLNLYVAEIKNITWDFSAPDDPVVNDPEEQTVTGEAKEITENSASITCYANNILDNEATDLKMGIIYCDSGTPNKSNGTQITVTKSQIAADGKYTVTLTGLTRGTTYYYRSFVYQSGLWFYGKVRSFSTIGQEIDAQFTTGAASSITCFSAKVSAQMNLLKATLSYSSMSYGICYGTSAEPTQTQQVSSKDASGNYTTTLRALEGNTVYYYRPYVQVDGVMYYGPTSSFQTLADNVVKTGDADAEGWVKSRLTIGGGAYSKLEVGLCWSIRNQTPTVADKTATTNELDDENYYNLQIKGFRTVYYRAYVMIDGVAHYGAAKSIKMPDYEYVDLDLSVKWATCNVGATAPEDYGDYFAWGETKAYGEEDTSNAMNYSYTSGQGSATYTKTYYDWSTYKYCNGSYTTQTKYCTSYALGTVDNKTVLESADDAATANWGGAWRMPTNAEQDELRNNCNWTRTTQNGVFGYKVTGKNGNSIFLPAAGYRSGSSLFADGSGGDYWSSSLHPNDSDNAYSLGIDWSGGRRTISYRNNGQSVRPVCQ